MSTRGARSQAEARGNRPDPALAAAISQLPSFVRAPIFMPTDRMRRRDALAGLARVRELYESGLDLTYRPRLRELKAARQSRRCFVIGNGPSLAQTDLSLLANEATFATNGFFLKMPELDWSPTYYVVEDHLVGEDRASELSKLAGTTKLFPASLAYALPPDDNTIYFDHRPRKSYPDGFDFSFDADINTYTGGTVTFTCMQLAAYFGYQEIYLIGVDADYSIPADAALSGGGRVKEIDMRSDDPNHFHPDYFGKGKRWHEPNVQVMLGAYTEARRATETRGVSIVNATLGGKLEVFPRIDYDMLFRPVPEERLLLIDHTQMGNATATGEVKVAVLGNWPPEGLMQLYDAGHGRMRIAGGPADIENGGTLEGQIAAFAPDLIMYRPVPRKEVLHDFAMELIEKTNLPLALWIVDDWPSSYAVEDPGPAAALEADFRWLVARADARFSISTSMSAAFHERYGAPFVPIANGVDPGDWPRAEQRLSGHLRVRYAGSLAENMSLGSVGLVARAVEKLGDSGLDISLEIKTHRHWHSPEADWLTSLRHTSVSTSNLAVTEYRRWLSDADVLVIAYNFDARSREYIRYSLANKLPECLASGAAVLGVGPEDVATIATMAALDVGELVTLADEDLVASTLRRLAASPESRFDIARRGQTVAFSLFGVSGTRQAFENSVGRVAAAHHAGEYPRDLHAHVDETEVVATLLGERRGPDHVMLDVGAARGSSAAHFDRLGWDIHCFEPQATSREALTSRFGSHRNIRIDPRAIADAPATGVPLYESEESEGITALRPFRPSHHAAGTVEVTTITEVIRERALSKVDFLKIDVEGLDLAVLKGVPWADLRPDVVECEFEDAKTTPQGHRWQDIGDFLRNQGYTVYVSEWHPIERYGTRHSWRRVIPFVAGSDEIHPAAWGNLVAFRADPGWDNVRQAFDRHIVRGAARTAAPPRRPQDGTISLERERARRATSVGEHGQSPARSRRDRLRAKSPTLYRLLRLSWRGGRELWRQRRWTLPLAALLVLWALVGFLEAFAPISALVWSSAAYTMVLLAALFATYRVYRSARQTARQVKGLRRVRDEDARHISEASARIGRLEKALADSVSLNAELRRKVARLEANVAEGQARSRRKQTAIPIVDETPPEPGPSGERMPRGARGAPGARPEPVDAEPRRTINAIG